MRKPSVRLSNTWINTKRKIWRDFYTIRKIIQPSFLRKRLVGGGDPFSTWNFGSTGPRWSKIANFQLIFARSGSDVTQSEKVQLTLMGSPLRAFQWTWDDHCTLSLSPQKGAQKRKTANFHLKSHFIWRKSATKFLCGKTVIGKVVRHSLASVSMQIWLVGLTPSTGNFGSNWPRWSEIFDRYWGRLYNSGWR